MRQLFIYGTLRDPALLSVVLGRDISDIQQCPAQLPGFEICTVQGHETPVARRDQACRAKGLLVSGLCETDIERLKYYAIRSGYHLSSTRVKIPNIPEPAEVFVSDIDDRQRDGDWSLAAWTKADQGISVEAAKEVMEYFSQRPAYEVFEHYPTLRIRAQSRLAAKSGKPVELRTNYDRSDVERLETRRPYLDFFALEEHRLRFRKFDRSYSAPVDRAVFLAADAVTVLPFDPVNDLVLLIEQFRAGPFGRGDPNPWCLEPVAGRVDVGESYAETAHREVMEETGIHLKTLENIASYYSSPGAFSEYLASYIGICDLADAEAGVHGLDSENEDIRTLILPFERLMDAVESGEADNGPLLVSALWLARNRDQLRKKHRAG